MEALRELLDLIVRWIHVIAGIMWIGNSLLFNWLDRNLRPAHRPRAGSRGEIWLLHSGGFYEVEKTLTPGDELPRPLHWFKWQAYTTWLSGACLLVLVYYMRGAALLVDPAAGLSPAVARAVAVAAILAAWLAYEALWSSRLRTHARTAALASLLLLLAIGYALGQLFTGRAAFLHVGAIMATIMAANVAFRIMPAQREQVAAVQRRAPPDAEISDRAKVRSMHNNYLTFPVIVLMLSSHFPSFYGAEHSWLVLGILVLAGVAVRHILNIRFHWRPWVPALGAMAAAATLLLYFTAVRLPARQETRNVSDGVAVTFEQAHAVITKRCAVCHSSSPADRTFGPMPGGVAFDTPEQIRALAPRIAVRAVETQTMPPANSTWMTAEERTILASWLRSIH